MKERPSLCSLHSRPQFISMSQLCWNASWGSGHKLAKAVDGINPAGDLALLDY